ncbi:tol-pal system protein YbgF [Methylobacterium aerolatum]|uniref:Cell division coordinator CpoB n=1 Tax=Methylobacterium aerolatum TaxID=418708 RepID=A0ABU0HTI3_9HYPH|nr:tol-pal system protein YbgF [Methylobacterium aerolatum]MDQ0445640.1 tol-pal system protein YbgF [Methylobacterium aerolatum]GJD36251.1 Cell division coordinator CpoB [Methylobacterium aerolatum]
MPFRLRTLLAATVMLPALLGPAAAQDASELVVRLGRLESQSRTMAGQIETLQYENRQLKEQLRKFQEDVDFRFNEGKGGAGGAAPAAKPSRAPAPAATTAPAPSAGPVNGGNPGFAPAPAKREKRGDAFDPSENPNAPGAPQQLGMTAPSAPLPARGSAEADAEDGGVPLPRAAIDDNGAGSEGYDDPVDLNPPRRTGAINPTARSADSIAAIRPGDAEPDYDAAVELVRAKQYEQAEMSLRQFIQSHPRDGRVAGATYWLGESYLARGRTREAAEQFLKVSTDYARSSQAPEAMLKLGVSLNALGAKEQACATLAELERKFPNAGANVRQNVTREQKRARCAA